MKRYLNHLIVASLLVFGANRICGQKATTVHKDSLNAVVEKYYDLNVKIFQANSRVAEIDSAFSLFTDDFTYAHPKYGGTYSREDLYNGYVRNQQKGGYDGRVIDIEVLNKIIGLNAAVVEKRFVEKVGDGIKKGELEMTLFEFRNGRISRILEYW